LINLKFNLSKLQEKEAVARQTMAFVLHF
jgi:hypothetical protein